MAYNNYFPIGYQSPYYQPQQMPQMPQQGQQSSLQQGSPIWVQGEAGAKSYLVAPNSTVQLWDSEANVIYIKSADASGMPNMRILDYTIRDSVQKQPETLPSVTYATKDELSVLKKEFDELQKKIGDLFDE